MVAHVVVLDGTVSKSNIKIVGRGKIDTSNTQRHGRSLFWLGTDTSMKSGDVKLVLCKYG